MSKLKILSPLRRRELFSVEHFRIVGRNVKSISSIAETSAKIGKAERQRETPSDWGSVFDSDDRNSQAEEREERKEI
ncbi:hypothetical protein [Streptomyces sp. NPDC003077]|uniref:hypothetical protein n=1 Tax=Streptomyces sp. NPDC003077 TaxID=3154443 RepID=UPI0033B8207C